MKTSLTHEKIKASTFILNTDGTFKSPVLFYSPLKLSIYFATKPDSLNSETSCHHAPYSSTGFEVVTPTDSALGMTVETFSL
jgi:hypothetical protein